MNYYLILNSDFDYTGKNVLIIQSSPKKDDLERISSYDPTKKISITRLAFKNPEEHPVTNQEAGIIEDAKIFQA